VVAADDLNRLLGNWGSIGPAPVPEPAAGAFVVLGVMLMAIRRRLGM
jgi:hypothetical protein